MSATASVGSKGAISHSGTVRKTTPQLDMNASANQHPERQARVAPSGTPAPRAFPTNTLAASPMA